MTHDPYYKHPTIAGGNFEGDSMSERKVPRQDSPPTPGDGFEVLPKPATAPRVFAPIPPKVFAALIAVKKGIASVPKDQTDSDEGRDFRYASVDAIYEATRELCAKAGLMIFPLEIDARWALPLDGTELRYQIIYQFFAQAEEECWTHPHWRKTIIAPYQGSKTTTAMESMAVKAMYRTLFQISTGEPDPVEAPRAENTGADISNETFGARTYACQDLIDELAYCDSISALNTFIADKEKVIGKLSKVEAPLISALIMKKRRTLLDAAGIPPEQARRPVNAAARKGRADAGNENEADPA